MRSLKNNLRSAVSLEELLKNVEEDPLFYFETYPITEIRSRCLQLMLERKYPVSSEKEAEWAEKQIMFFLEERRSDWRTAEKLFAWYIAGTENTDTDKDATVLTVRAVEFALGLYFAHEHYFLENVISKEVSKRLRKSDAEYVYPAIPSIKNYLLDLIIHLFPGGIYRRIRFKDARWEIDAREYIDSTWHDVERALSVINHVEDTSFIGILDETLQLYEEGTIYPWRPDAYQVKGFVKDMHMRIISGAIDHLTECCQRKREERREAIILKTFTL